MAENYPRVGQVAHTMTLPNQSAPANRRPAALSGGLGNLAATVAAGRALRVPNAATRMLPTSLALRSAHRGPAAVAELGSLGVMDALATTMIQIKECRTEDFDSIVALLRQLWPDKPLDFVSLRRVYDRALASDRQVYLCAVCNQQAVGFGSLTIKSNLWSEAFVGYVDEMVVNSAHRGRGIGTQILDHLISYARERGCNRIELDSAFQRKDAHVFYERRGFQSRAYLYSKLL